MSKAPGNKGQGVADGSDNEIMLQVRGGETGALAILFERHNERLLNFFMKLTGRRSLSEDLVQDVFMRMLKYRETYRGEGGGFAGWMFTMARNAHTDHIRRSSRHNLPALPEQEPESSAPGAEATLEGKESLEILRQALIRLSPEKREVLILRRFEFKKFNEIAELLDCPISTVKVRAHRAIRELKTIYDSLHKEPEHEM